MLISCNNNKRNDVFLSQRLAEVNRDYKNRQEPFRLSVKLMDHYPKRIYNLPIKIESNLNSERNKNYSDFIVSDFGVNKEIIDSIEINLKSVLKIQSKTANDSTLMLITKDSKLCESLIPYFESNSKFDNPEEVVSWKDVYSHETISGLSKDFNIYLVDSGKLDVSEIDKAKRNKLGINKNCFSKGVAINRVKNILFYWIILW
ncbi:hypothetical protein D3C86_1464010 [compost metagenome]